VAFLFLDAPLYQALPCRKTFLSEGAEDASLVLAVPATLRRGGRRSVGADKAVLHPHLLLLRDKPAGGVKTQKMTKNRQKKPQKRKKCKKMAKNRKKSSKNWKKAEKSCFFEIVLK